MIAQILSATHPLLVCHALYPYMQEEVSNGAHPVESSAAQSKQSSFEQMLAAGANTSASDALAAAGIELGKLRPPIIACSTS
jgi:hypothetical protein